MKKMILGLLLFAFFYSVASALAVDVDGYWKDTNHDGVKDTYVKPHVRTAPNNTRTDNYDYPGNYNPNTGAITPQSSSPGATYPSTPNPYQKKSPYGW